MVSATLLCVALAVLPHAGSPRADTLPRPGTITGELRTPGGEPVSHGAVQALPGGKQTISDSRGTFRFTGLPTGLVVLHIRALGFQARYFQVELSEAQGWRGTVQLEFVAQILPEVVVRGAAPFWTPPEYAYTHKYDDFFMRMHRGFGTFLGREEIQRRNAGTLLELLQGIPGIRVRWNPPGSPAPTTVRIARCDGNPPPLAFYIDGIRVVISSGDLPKTAGAVRFGGGDRESQFRAEEKFEETLNSIHPRSIEMMEIYRGVSELPGDLARDVCAAIVVWTH